jgi:hypothetical protein
MRKKIPYYFLLVISLCSISLQGQSLSLDYEQDFSGFVFETGTQVLTFGPEQEWSFTASGSAAGRLDYLGDWGSGTSAGFRGNAQVMGYQHTTTTGVLTASLTLPNNTGAPITMLTVGYTGRVERPTVGRSPAWTVTVNGQEVPALAYSTESGVDEQRVAEVMVNIAPGENIIIQWSSDNGPGSGASRQIGIGAVTVAAADPTQAAAPVFSPPPGVYDDPVEVTMSTATPDATIYYTINGGNPTPDDFLYDGTPVLLEESATIRARTFHDELDPSEISVGTYTVAEVVLAVTGVENPPGISVNQGTPFDALELPTTVLTYFDDGTSGLLYVEWQPGNYDPEVPAVYTIMGDLQLETEIVNPDNIRPQIEVTVTDFVLTYPVTFNLTLDASLGFDPETDAVFITGSMFDWAIPGTLPEQQRMSHQGGLSFSTTLELEPGTHTYKYYFNAGIANPEAGPNRSITVDGPKEVFDSWVLTSIENHLQTMLNAYPNPASTQVTFEADAPIETITFFGTDGRIHLQVNPLKNRAEICTASLPVGLYLARVQWNNGAKTIRIQVLR